MASAKTDLFPKATVDLARMAKAMAHPARIVILEFLIEQDRCICGTIVDALPLSQSSVSQHLKELKEAGLIRGEIDGPRVCYCINPETFQKLGSYLSDLIVRAAHHQNCC